MFSFCLAAVSEETTDIVKWVSVGSVAALALLFTVVLIVNKKYSTAEIAYAGICLALSFALSFIKFSPVQFGGSITLASFVPLMIYAYRYGALKGTLAGMMLGLFNFISEPFILTPLTFVLDYLLAFASIGIMGLAAKLPKLSVTAKVCIGAVAVYAARFIFHLLSGFIYFAENAVWVDLPTPNMFVYSLIYQCVYLPADCAICVGVMFALAKSNALSRLYEMMGRKQHKSAPAENGQTAQNAESAAPDLPEKADNRAN